MKALTPLAMIAATALLAPAHAAGLVAAAAANTYATQVAWDSVDLFERDVVIDSQLSGATNYGGTVAPQSAAIAVAGYNLTASSLAGAKASRFAAALSGAPSTIAVLTGDDYRNLNSDDRNARATSGYLEEFVPSESVIVTANVWFDRTIQIGFARDDGLYASLLDGYLTNSGVSDETFNVANVNASARLDAFIGTADPALNETTIAITSSAYYGELISGDNLSGSAVVNGIGPYSVAYDSAATIIYVDGVATVTYAQADFAQDFAAHRVAANYSFDVTLVAGTT